jgi:hypothetical protein
MQALVLYSVSAAMDFVVMGADWTNTTDMPTPRRLLTLRLDGAF